MRKQNLLEQARRRHAITKARLLNTANSLNLTKYKQPFMKKDDGKVRPNSAALRRLRKQCGYTRKRLEVLTGITMKTLRNLEAEPDYRCYPSTLGVLAQHYNVSPSSLILPENYCDIFLEITDALCQIDREVKTRHDIHQLHSAENEDQESVDSLVGRSGIFWIVE